MSTIKVWTRQHHLVLEELEATGRYTAKASGILHNEDSQLMKPCYDWLAAHLPQEDRPADAEYPVWLSLEQSNSMLPSPETVTLELELDERLVTLLNVTKWGAVNNFSYLPADEADARRHKRLLRDYGVSDAKACMTPFYPEIKQEIEKSWERLFDDRIQLGSPLCYGLCWELRREWIRKIIR